MKQRIHTLVFPVTDLARAKPLYAELLGTEPYVDEAYYVGYRVGDVELGLDPNGHRQGRTQPVAFWEVEDIEQAVGSLVDAGAAVQEEIRAVGGGKRIAVVKDADGNLIGLAHSP